MLPKTPKIRISASGRGPADDPVSAGNDDGPISGFCSPRRLLNGLPRLYGAELGGLPSDGIGRRHGGT
ncbi:unnamed protein product [Fusarium graminearum]|uniref:Chromosome 2, complete genome n=1 Tax=Gibberella zeae (strain ATCC MYA-4620 / CBS 123657 / FGSC 9075 / NRRL 31084 / PH-1) TaxID=229533 RepID=A0A098DKP4_GIBZE|nr:unnamed protein product [Fusarium graminearum]